MGIIKRIGQNACPWIFSDFLITWIPFKIEFMGQKMTLSMTYEVKMLKIRILWSWMDKKVKMNVSKFFQT